MNNCEHNCENCSMNCSERTTKIINSANNNVKNVIGVVSGKGGVGKSLVTSLLATTVAKNGLRAAILDADITGPSIPKAFGIQEQIYSDGQFIQPAMSRNGIKIVSMNLCLQNENEPVVWRGPVISGVVKQFWEEVDWGEVDYMFVDMPPGTGDVPLTVFQVIPLKGIIIVTTPQELVSMIVIKALKMAEMMKIPVLGIVENMSYFECPNCKTKHYIFGRSHVKEIALTYGINKVVEMPMKPELAELCDEGEIEKFKANNYFDKIFE